MSYTVDYSSRKGREKYEAAIADCQAYLGTDTFNRVVNAIKLGITQDKLQLAQVTFSLAFVGIQGYPAKALNAYAHKQLREESL